MMKTEAQILADTMDRTRQLTKFFLSKLKEIEPYRETELGGIKFNSIYWLLAHLIWAEDNLIIVGTGGKSAAPAWAKHYKVGSDGSLHADHPDFKTILHTAKEVHQKAMEHLHSFPDEKLSADNIFGFNFGDGDLSNRMMINHAIRHEGSHIGNFSWLAKMHGLKLL